MNATRIIAFVLSSIILLPPTLSFADPINLDIVSSENWRSSDTPTKGWETLSFDDSGWSFARSPYPGPTDPTALIPGTSAQFIWHDPAGTSNGGTGPIEAFFRFTFDLEIQPDSLPLVGQALINVDDDYNLFINGNLVFQNHDNGFSDLVDFVDFTSFLRNGPNVIAIHAVDGGWSYPKDRINERVLFDGQIRTVPALGAFSMILIGFLGLVGLRSRGSESFKRTTRLPA
jgi:hypothetical protein